MDVKTISENSLNNCYYLKSLRVLSKKWTVFIVLQLLEFETLNFTNIQNRIKKQSEENLSATVLSGSLSTLEEQGIVKRKVLSEKMPIRVIYSLTEKGKELGELLNKIDIWTNKWENNDGKKHREKCKLCKQLPHLLVEVIAES
ncbi:MAG: HTH-type transcriptional regulator YodB [Candidatus Heimdallarchaeota archaeon LC_3]|nr:MAG: HTH-type transcriptional regulator YodB [Candidatus Heimdallarchaeota archaeon LC_3]